MEINYGSLYSLLNSCDARKLILEGALCSKVAHYGACLILHTSLEYLD